MTQPADHRTVTADEARAEYVAKCNEVAEIETVIRMLDQGISKCLQRGEPVVFIDRDGIPYTSDAFWLLLDLHREAVERRTDLDAACRYAHTVWLSASAAATGVDGYVSTPTQHPMP
jgi:hypothetical protein